MSSEQRQALNQFSTDNQSGFYLDSTVNLDSVNTVSVIISFKNKPQKIAKLEAVVKGKSLSDEQAKSNAEADHETFKKDLDTIFKDKSDGSYKIKREYKHAFNGVALEVPANKLNELMKSDAVLAIYSDVTVQAEPSIENSTKTEGQGMADERAFLKVDQLHQRGYTGKGVKVAILDTGIDYNHPDLKDAYEGGYDFVNNENDPMETTYEDWIKAGKPGNAAAYVTDHGTHVSGTIAGQGTNKSEYATKGIAPDAQIYAYRVLGPGGSGATEGIIAAIDHAVAEGMDVMNLSLGANYNDPMYPTSIAINNAVLSGVTAIVAAGNAGNKMYTLGSPGTAALALTVGASSVPITTVAAKGSLGDISADLRFMARGYTDDITELKGQVNTIVDVGIGDPAGYSGKNVNGKIVLISRGTYTLDSKIAYAKSKGAAIVLMYNDNREEGYIPAYFGEGVNFIPTFNLTHEDGLALKQKIQAGSNSFTFTEMSEAKTEGDTMADFSSRGPSRVTYEIKPEITAPGVSVLSTVPSFINSPNDTTNYSIAYKRMSGTSMATPFTSGVAALLLQAKPELEPEEVKAILMNTADPLTKPYSVFEQGAGRVDPFEAIHSSIEIKVKDKTTTISTGKEKQIKEETGALSFGKVVSNEKDFKDSRNVTIENNGVKEKTFDVKVTFQSDVRESKDAEKNGVELKTDVSIKVPANSQITRNVSLSIPKTAEIGVYEGFIVYTNHEDPSETYQVPFGVRVVNEGIETFNVVKPLYSTDTAWPANSYPFLGFEFTLKSHMKTLDVILHDPKTGKDLGLVGSFDPILINNEQSYFIARGFSNVYYPFTNDSDNPISYIPEIVQTGHYQLKLVGTNEEGKAFTAASDVIYELAAPTMTSTFDALEQKVIEYNDSQFNEKGEFLYDFNINLHDPEVEQANRFGSDLDQSSNSVVSFYNSPFPANPIKTDKDGNYTDQILVRKQAAPLDVAFYGFDAAGNFTADASHMLKVVFVDHKLPYYYLKANKKTVTTGESVNYSVRSNNVKNLKTTKITLPVDPTLVAIENVAVNEAVKQYGDAHVSVTSTPSGSRSNYSLTFTYLGNKALPEDLELFNFDLKALNKYTRSVPFSWYSMSASTIDQSDVETKNVYTYMETYTTKSTYSKLDGALKLEGTINPSTGEMNYAIEQRNIGAKVTVTSDDGNTIIEAPITTKNGSYSAEGIKAEKTPYIVKVDVPGHFTINKQLVLSNEIRGETVGKRQNYHLPIAAAGDSNKDDVIDVLDALEVQKYWGSDHAPTDFNFDKVVDEKDMNYITKNYGLQNPTVADAPKAKDSYKGTTLDNILTKLGLK
ncbi:S8 family serine peptidase [Peribacillus acanthi]|uniref:S8 family serine peptidase n=1 Tax=Peribacillus acanthi TaxID=2171554 RepID=UPI000D3E3ABE|nr:S8 family serine peptidase [Peribacillus acanthi]